MHGNNIDRLPLEIGGLSSLAQLTVQEDQLTALPLSTSAKQWDVFISHASEDKESVAIPLADALRRAGLKVWLDKSELTIGDSLRASIDAGLSESRFGVVIISAPFLQKRWPKQELNGLFAIEDEGHKVILPVWHNLTKSEVLKHSPILADRLAADTSHGIRNVAAQIVDIVLYRTPDSPSTLFPTLTRLLVHSIEREPDASRLRDFLLAHTDILGRACGAYAIDLPIVNVARGDQVDIIVSVPLGTSGNVARYEVVLGPRSGAVFDRNGQPSHELATCVARFKKPAKGPEYVRWAGIVCAGRRLLLSTEERSMLREYNKRGLEVRTYDWLIDACMEVQSRLANDI